MKFVLIARAADLLTPATRNEEGEEKMLHLPSKIVVVLHLISLIIIIVSSWYFSRFFTRDHDHCCVCLMIRKESCIRTALCFPPMNIPFHSKQQPTSFRFRSEQNSKESSSSSFVCSHTKIETNLLRPPKSRKGDSIRRNAKQTAAAADHHITFVNCDEIRWYERTAAWIQIRMEWERDTHTQQNNNKAALFRFWPN